jgi:hypothetical protein
MPIPKEYMYLFDYKYSSCVKKIDPGGSIFVLSKTKLIVVNVDQNHTLPSWLTAEYRASIVRLT